MKLGGRGPPGKPGGPLDSAYGLVVESVNVSVLA
jgi:hypothetical protein